MRILYIDHHASMPLCGGDTRAFELAQQWQQMGDEVVILAAQYSHRRRCNPELVEDFTEKKCGEVRFCYLLTPSYERGVGSIYRNMTAFLKKLYQNASLLAERYHPEIIISACGYPYDFFCMQRMAKLCHAKMVFEMREIWPALQRELYPAEESRVVRAAGDYAMDYALKNANLVVSLLPGGEGYCRERKVNPKSFCRLEAGASPLPESGPLRGEDAEALQSFRAEFPFLLAFAGKLSSRRQPELLVGALSELGGTNIGAVLCGNGGYKLLLKRLLRDGKIKNVLLLDAQSERRQQTLFEAANAIYYSDARQISAKYGAYCPLLLQMMRQGKPLIVAANGEKNPAVQCGAALCAETEEALPAALRRLAGMPEEERKKMGACGLAEIKAHHSPEQTASAYRQALLRLWA